MFYAQVNILRKSPFLLKLIRITVLCTLLDHNTLDRNTLGNGDGSEKMIRTSSSRVKNLRFYSTCKLQVNLPQFYGSWQDFWIRAKWLYNNSTASSLSFMFLSVPLAAQVSLGPWRVAQVGACAYSAFASRLRNPKLRVPDSFITSSNKSSQLWHWREHYLYYTGQ